MLYRIDNYGVGIVLRSEAPSFKSGDHVYGMFRKSISGVYDVLSIAYSASDSSIYLEAFQHYFISKEPKSFRVIKNEARNPWSTYVGVNGMPGLSHCHTRNCPHRFHHSNTSLKWVCGDFQVRQPGVPGRNSPLPRRAKQSS